MTRWISSLACLALLVSTPSAATDTEVCQRCAEAEATNGWCDVHHVGFVGSVRVTSEWLYEAVDAHGHEVDPTTFDCPSCRKAIASDGFCEEHRIGFLDGKAYFSRLTYLLWKGESRTAEENEALSRALDLLRAANREADRCEHCAVALFTDTRCPVHKILYRDGKPVDPEEPAADSQ